MSNKPPTTATPGWNDPPTLQYNPTSSAAGRTRLNLNKRVAFPLDGSGNQINSTTLPSTTGVPPRAATVLPPPPAAFLPALSSTTLTPIPASVSQLTTATSAVQPTAEEQLIPTMQSTDVASNIEQQSRVLPQVSESADGKCSSLQHL